MQDHVRKRLKRMGILCVAALMAGALIGWVQVQDQRNAAPKPIAGIKIGGPFELTDQNGNIVTDQSFPGQYKLIYFGFTYCPAICPTELGKITNVLKTMGREANIIQPVFITVDPERDTPEVLKSYLTMFHPKIAGLTGPKDKVDAVLKDYRIYAAKSQDPDMTEYTMDHSSFIYLINPQGDLLSVYRMEDTAEYMIKDIHQKLSS
jgi:protein SCO1